MGFKGEVTAALKMVASGNQIFTISLGAISALSLVGAFALIWTNKQNWEVFLWASGAAGAVATLAWFLSRRDTDLANGQATNIKWSDGELTLIADPRLGPPVELLEKAAKFATAVASRQPLPSPKGLVDDNLHPVPGSSEEAIRKINELNSYAKVILDQYASKLGLNDLREVSIGRENPDAKDVH